MFEQMKKNTVEATNQLKESEFVRFENPEGKGIRVMFAGNSITLHSKKKSSGKMIGVWRQLLSVFGKKLY